LLLSALFLRLSSKFVTYAKISKLNCEKSSGYSYFYLAEKENNIPIYIEVEVNLTEEPYMSPLYTIFEFYQHKQPEWGC
ncbi:hypothetical protein, partial [Kingella oralis]|uniref:hypothetical protein n=1 Tax=Kingella oralis TaxID=505 RepID=UPI002D7FE10E